MDRTNEDLSDSIKKCSCIECNNDATRFLQIVYTPRPGYFCNQCASDLKWHGIAKEDMLEEEVYPFPEGYLSDSELVQKNRKKEEIAN